MKLSSVCLFILVSCVPSCKNKQLSQYEKLVSRITTISFERINSKQIVISNPSEIEHLKRTLVDKIQPDTIVAGTPSVIIKLLDGYKLLGTIETFEYGTTLANFKSPELNFGFLLTYRLGMFISETR